MEVGKDMRKQGGSAGDSSAAGPSVAAAAEAGGPEDFGDVSQYRELNAIGTGELTRARARAIT